MDLFLNICFFILFTLLFSYDIDSSSSKGNTDSTHWAVHIHGGEHKAREIASRNGFHFHGQVCVLIFTISNNKHLTIPISIAKQVFPLCWSKKMWRLYTSPSRKTALTSFICTENNCVQVFRQKYIQVKCTPRFSSLVP